jgi:EmrB/QacA subfamily drug resistance transporter
MATTAPTRTGAGNGVAAPPRPAAAPPAPPTAKPEGPGWLLAVVVLVVGNFMAVLDITIVNVAVPSIQGDFGGSLDDVLWIATAYTLMLGVVVPLSSFLGDRFGLSYVYVYSLAGFAVCSALCGLAWDLTPLIVFRVIQAIPGGIMPVVAMTLVYRLVPREKLGTAMGVFGLGVVFAPAVGPVLGGYFVEYLDWRLVFFINTPVGIVGAVAAYIVLPKVRGTAGRRFDLPGFLTIAAGLFAILLAASEGSDWGWDGYRIRMLLVGGALSLALFVVIELERDEPLLDLRVFRNWSFTAALIMVSVVTMNLLAVAFFLPVFLQQGQHKEALDAGLLLLPPAIVTGLLSPVTGRLYDKVGPSGLAMAGMVITGFGTYLLCSVHADTPNFEIVFWGCVRGVGLSMSIMPVMTAGLAALPPRQTNLGSALTNVARQTSGALGLAVLSAISTSQQAQLMGDRGALVQGQGDAVALQSSPELFAQAYGRYEHLSAQVLGTSYGNLYLITAVITVAVAPLAWFLRPANAAPPGAAAGH